MSLSNKMIFVLLYLDYRYYHEDMVMKRLTDEEIRFVFNTKDKTAKRENGNAN